MKIFGLFLAAFFLMLLLTQNQVGLSCLGALWLTFSSFVQWWLSTPAPEMIISTFGMILASIYLLYSQNRCLVVLSALLLAVFTANLLFFCYPPYQIPLFYLYVFLMAGYLLANHRLLHGQLWFFKTFSALVALGLLIAVLWLFYRDARETITIVQNTVYPGQRLSPGGSFSLTRYIAGFFLLLFNEAHYPQAWFNICEASNFILLYPFIFLAMVYHYGTGKKLDPLLSSLMLCIIFLSLWMLAGYPSFVAKFSLLNRVPENRALISVGLASLLASVRFLSDRTLGCPCRGPGWFLVVVIIMAGLGAWLNLEIHRLINWGLLLSVAVLVAWLVYAFVNHQTKIFAGLILALVVVPNLTVNPVSSGLGDLYGRKLLQTVSAIKASDPEAAWIVFGNRYVSQFLITSGLNVMSGVKYSPDLAGLKVLDPEGKHLDIYNRFAHVEFLPAAAGGKIAFQNPQTDIISITIEPCAPALRDLAVKYFLFTSEPPPGTLGCLGKIYQDDRSDISIYQRTSP
jgi:uncharacterized membrane protein YhdT